MNKYWRCAVCGDERLPLGMAHLCRVLNGLDKPDLVNHPAHYTQHPSGVECITVTEHFNFNVGNAIKYLWRAGLKNDAVEDLRKAEFYVRREIQRLGGSQNE